MIRRMVRDPLAPMLVLSVLIHVGLRTWLGHAPESGPERIAPQRGRSSIHLLAAVAAAPDRPRPLPPDPPVRPRRPELTGAALTPLRDWLVAAADPARRLATWIAEAPPDAAPDRSEPPPPSPPAPKPPEPERPPEPTRADPARAADSRPAPGSTASEGADVEEMPRLLSNPAPRYPAEALTGGVQGVVLLRVRVGADGRVVSAGVYRSSGVAALDEAALDAIRRWRFTPARRRGVPVAREVAVPVRFTIRGR